MCRSGGSIDLAYSCYAQEKRAWDSAIRQQGHAVKRCPAHEGFGNHFWKLTANRAVRMKAKGQSQAGNGQSKTGPFIQAYLGVYMYAYEST